MQQSIKWAPHSVSGKSEVGNFHMRISSPFQDPRNRSIGNNPNTHGISGTGGPVAMDLDVDMDMEVEVETEAEAVVGITEVNEAVGPVEFLHEDGAIAASPGTNLIAAH
ncbi:hypothetical protein LTR28_011068 [Elasticomyces elasticus]|nr:hypothetical protein LTR28_011068 [Elasticomyces elasticus]